MVFEKFCQDTLTSPKRNGGMSIGADERYESISVEVRVQVINDIKGIPNLGKLKH